MKKFLLLITTIILLTSCNKEEFTEINLQKDRFLVCISIDNIHTIIKPDNEFNYQRNDTITFNYDGVAYEDCITSCNIITTVKEIK